MADGTKIEWADATVNAINGCSLASPGCTNCYAMRLAGTRLRNHPSREGLTTPSKAGPAWNGTVKLSESALLQPLRWRAPRVIFWNAHGDTFHDAVPDAWIDRMFAVMALTPQHKHLVLTKRAARMREYFRDRSRKLARHMIDEYLINAPDVPRKARAIAAAWPVQSVGDVDDPDDVVMRQWPLPNVWLGVSVEDQVRADVRIPDLIHTPAAGRFLSCEPLLGPIDLHHIDINGDAEMDALNPRPWSAEVEEWRGTATGWEADFEEWFGVAPDRVSGMMHPVIDGVIVGGESGTGARPMHPDWARSLRDQCADAGVDFHFKQWGAYSPLRAARPVEGEGVGEVAWPDGTVGGGDASQNGGAGQQMYCSTKSIAGRELDGITYDALPWRRDS